MAQPCQVREVVRVDFPQQTKALSYKTLQTIIEGDHENSDFLKSMLNNHAHYKIDSFLLNLYAERFNAPKNYLETQKKEWEKLCRWGRDTCTWPMEIKNINNYAVLIVNTDFGPNGGYYFFFTINKKQNATLSGSVYYYGFDKNSRIKCRATLDELLDNIAYKL